MFDDFQDVEFEDVNKETQKNIRGKVLYYSTSQVAEALGETDSKIRYYTSAFDDILNIEITNKQRRYTDKDIDKLKFIIELKNSGMTIRQIQEYCQEVDFENENGIQIKETNPLSIQTLAKALMEEQHNQLMKFKEEIKDELLGTISQQLNNQIQTIKENNENTKNEILEKVSITVDGVIDDKLDVLLDTQNSQLELYKQQGNELNDIIKSTIKSELNENAEAQTEFIKTHINLQEQQATEKIDNLLKILENRKEQYEKDQQEKEKSRGFFGKLFGK